MELKRTPLYELCITAGARMVPFAGWEMPIQFSGLVKEHQAVRQNAGVFDISHMGVLRLSGENPKDYLQQLVPSDLYRIGPGEACYTVLLNEKGGIIDDLIVYDLGQDNNKKENLLIVINAACFESDTRWLKDNLKEYKIDISDAKKDGALLALQGRQSTEIIEQICEDSLNNLPRFGHRQITFNKLENCSLKTALIARTGYTGEDGFELLLPADLAKSLWEKLLSEGVQPCGLGARDTLRLEAAMHLYGQDMNCSTTPFEAGLGWLVHLEMPKQFIGKAALDLQAKEGINRRLVGLQIDQRAIARNGYQVLYEGQQVGEITSGTWSPTLQKAIALTYLPTNLTSIGTELQVEIRGELHLAKVVKRPFYRRN